MSLFDRIRERRFAPGPGVSGPSPKSGGARYSFLFKTHFWKLVSLNLLVVVFSIPIVTIPAAMAGGAHVLMKLVRTGNCFLWDDFWEEFKRDFLHRAPIGLSFFALPALAYMICYNLDKGALGAGLAAGLGLIFYPAACYWYSLITTVDLPTGANTKNAFLLISLEGKTTLKLELMLLIHVAVVFLLPYTIPVIVLMSFSFIQLGACVMVWPALQRRVIAKDASEAPADDDSGSGAAGE